MTDFIILNTSNRIRTILTSIALHTKMSLDALTCFSRSSIPRYGLRVSGGGLKMFFGVSTWPGTKECNILGFGCLVF